MMMTFKVCILNSENRINDVYVYGATDTQFSEAERATYERDESEIHYSDQQIHSDDSIRIIKNKILKEMNYSASYSELYMFSYATKSINISDIYKHVTKQDTENFTHNDLVQLLTNINVRNTMVDKEIYDFMDLSNNIPKDSIVKIPIGFGEPDHLFSINPLDCVYETKPNQFYMYDNLLLFNFGNMIDNVIYVCPAANTFEHATNSGLNVAYFAESYYPYLFEQGIRSVSELMLQKQRLIEESKNSVNDDVWKMYKTVDMFYDIYNKREPKSDLKYENEGIKYFNIGIKTEFVNILPLDSIFKTIHATANMPFIKFNQGLRRESIYRLYSEKTAINGHKIPTMSKNEIARLSKESKKTGEITIYLKDSGLKLVFKKDGSMQVQSTPRVPISVNELNVLLENGLNSAIDDINGFIESTGYRIHRFSSLSDPLVEILELKYTSSIKIDRKMDISTNRGCISSIFNIENASSDGATMRFRRVDNYQQMDPIDELIINEKRKQSEISDIIRQLIEEFGINEETARARVVANYANSDEDTNSGFPTLMQFIPSEKKMVIDIDNINAIEYIDILKLYLDSIIRIYQNPKINVNELCKKKVDYTKIDTVIVKNVVAVNKEQEKEHDTEFFGTKDMDMDLDLMDSDVDVDESGFDFEGGAPENDDEIIEKNVEGIKIKNPNPFYKRLLDREPALILTHKTGKYNPYAKACPPADNRQPVILNNDEIERTNKESYFGEPLKYRNNYYICPRYWSLKTDSSLSQSEVDEILKTHPKAIIPSKAPTVPKGAFIYKFETPSEHIDKNGKYIDHYPGLQMDSHPDGLGLPCCFTKQSLISKVLFMVNTKFKDISRDQETAIIAYFNKHKDITESKIQVMIAEHDTIDSFINVLKISEHAKETNKGDKNTYFFEPNKYPVPKNRRGFLPIQAQRFFKFDNNKCISKTNMANLKPDTRCLIRYGVEGNSFIGCFADIYKEYHQKTLTNEQMRTILISTITIDDFLKYNLLPIFREPVNSANIDLTPYKDSNLVRFIDETKDKERTLLYETIGAYKNFIEFLKGDFDHTYMWDIIAMPNPKLIPSGLNLVILNIKQENEIDYICSPIAYDPNKGTIILLKQDEFYEPIYLCENKSGKFKDTKIFNNTDLPEIEQLSKKYCKPRKSMPTKYDFEPAKFDLHQMVELLRESNCDILQQIVNYQAKAVGVIVMASDSQHAVFIPCKPSPIDLNLDFTDGKNQVHIDFIDNALSNDYANTVNALREVSDKTRKKIKCLPVQKIVNSNGKIFGILTETNQFVRVEPQIDVKSIKDDIPVIYSSDYIGADISSREPDATRIAMIRNIRLESQFYSVFRSTIRTLMSYYENRAYKLDILNIIDYDIPRIEKIQRIEEELRNIIKESVIFQKDMEIQKLSNISSCISNCKDKSHCFHDNDTCRFQLTIPHLNLVTGFDNERLYYGRMADEIIRFRRIRSIMMEPMHYLNLSNITFKINDNEILLLDSAMNSDYFNELNIFNVNEYIKNITFDIAKPDSTQNYVNTYARTD
jgi:hypothetical protein